MNKKIISLILFLFVLLSGCEDEVTTPTGDTGIPPDDDVEEVISFTQTISGHILLENQPEHSNALIYLAGIEKGVGSDSSGHFVVQFADSDSVYTGEFTLYYFLEDYDLDSAFIWMQDGLVKLDTLDVDSSGNLPLKELRQILRVQGWTDKVEYHIGDSILVTLRFINISDRALLLDINNAWTPIGHVFLGRGENNNSFGLYPLVIINTNFTILLSPGEFHEGETSNTIIPEGIFIGETFTPLPLTEYVVATNFVLLERDKTLPGKLRLFIIHNWRDVHRGPLPRLDNRPNKLEYPIIRIIE